MYDLDKANGNVIGTEPAATAAKLSPSDDVSKFFGSTSDKLVRIELGDAVATTIADIPGIDVNCFDVKLVGGIDVHHFVAVGVGLQFRRWLYLHDDQCRVSTLLHYGRSRCDVGAATQSSTKRFGLYRRRSVDWHCCHLSLSIRYRRRHLVDVDKHALAVIHRSFTGIRLWRAVRGR
jgi:hypothetical protein